MPKNSRKISLANNTVGRRTADILDFVNNLKAGFLHCVDVATDVVKYLHLITHVQPVLVRDIKEDLSFCKPTDGRAISLEVFNLINHLVEDNEINWEKCTGLCTDRAQSMPDQNAALQAVVKR
jgi:hypothetical protein